MKLIVFLVLAAVSAALCTWAALTGMIVWASVDACTTLVWLFAAACEAVD